MDNGSLNNNRKLKEHRRKNATNVREENHSNRKRRYSVLRAACVCVCHYVANSYCMDQSPSEANLFSASEEIPLFRGTI